MSDTFQLYRCTECGKVSVSLGWLHGHIESHVGWGPFNLLPDPRKNANPRHLNEYTEVIQVTEWVSDPATEVPITNGGEIDTEVFDE